MKKSVFLALLLSGIFISGSMHAQTAGAKRTLLFSIGSGEYFLYGECRLLLSNMGNRVNLVTSNGEEFFLYENGLKKGPFSDVESTGFIGEDDGGDFYSSQYYEEYMELPSPELEYDENGMQWFIMNETRQGPFEAVWDVFINEAGEVYGGVAYHQGKSVLITSKGTRIEMKGNYSERYKSPVPDKLMILANKEFDFMKEMENVDFENMTQEQALKFTEEMVEKEKNAPPPETYIYFNDGTEFGPYPMDQLGYGNPSFSSTGAGNWHMIIENQLYINGVAIAMLPNDEYYDAGSVWISADGKRYALLGWEKLRFSDGSEFPAPVRLVINEQQGKVVFDWVSIENETELVHYSKAL